MGNNYVLGVMHDIRSIHLNDKDDMVKEFSDISQSQIIYIRRCFHKTLVFRVLD